MVDKERMHEFCMCHRCSANLGKKSRSSSGPRGQMICAPWSRPCGRTLQKVDPVLPVSEVRIGEDHADPQLGAVRLTAEVSMLLGLVALTLASLGLYGVISYAVSVRTREIGIRLALGAHSTNVRGLIIRQGMVLTAGGLAVGLAAALLATPVLQSMLVNLPATDPLTFAGVSALLLAIALVACYVPARRATRIDPIATLRAE